MMNTRKLGAILLILVIATLTTSCVSAKGGELRPIKVQNVSVEIGVGSPIPVDIFVSGDNIVR